MTEYPNLRTKGDADYDCRSIMEYEKTYRALEPNYCSVSRCQYTGGREDIQVFVTKHYWANRPKGQLMNRCVDHQVNYERRR